MIEKRENIILDKSFAFAVRIVKLYEFLGSKKETVLSKQLLRCGTSVGANAREAMNAENTADFIHKMSISQKEISEVEYWLDLFIYNRIPERKRILVDKKRCRGNKQNPPKYNPHNQKETTSNPKFITHNS